MKTILSPHDLADLKFLIAGTRLRIVHARHFGGQSYAVQVQDQENDGWRTALRFAALEDLFASREMAELLVMAASDTDEPKTAERLLELAADIVG